jgi:hypothetical protein
VVHRFQAEIRLRAVEKVSDLGTGMMIYSDEWPISVIMHIIV